MTLHPAIALQEAVYSALTDSGELATILGGSHIYDDVPRGRKPPYVTFGDATHSDWSTGDSEGAEHFFSLNVWSRARGRAEVLNISEQVNQVLDEITTAITDHHLVNLRHEFTECGKDPDTAYFLARLNYRAVTESLASPII